jgi:hypothetical protein
MFRALLAHPQEVLHKRHLGVMSVGCYQDWNGTPLQSWYQPTDITRTQYTKCRVVAPPEDEQVTLETCRDP